MGNFDFLETCYRWWFNRRGKYNALSLYISWKIWRARNFAIFEDRPLNCFRICSNILPWLSTERHANQAYKISRTLCPQVQVVFPDGFFDGTAQDGRCGCGAWLRINPLIHFLLFWYEGLGSNSKAKLLAFWGLVFFAKRFQLQKISVYGNSSSTIDAVAGRSSLLVPFLASWMENIEFLEQSFVNSTFLHVYRELKMLPDGLLKCGLVAEAGSIHYSFFVDCKEMAEGNFDL